MLPSPIILPLIYYTELLITSCTDSIFDKNQIKSTQQFDLELIINFVSIL